MEVDKLIPLSDYITLAELEIERYSTKAAKTRSYFESIIEYNRFLKTPLTLELFTSGKYFKDINIQDTQNWIDLYKGIRVYNHYEELPVDKWFSEVFENGKPRHHKTIGDLVHYELRLASTL